MNRVDNIYMKLILNILCFFSEDVYHTLKPHLKSSQSHILEVNAGAGVLTNFLLKSRLPRLRIYEADSGFFNDLQVSTTVTQLP